MPSVARRALRRVRAATGFAADGHVEPEKREDARARILILCRRKPEPASRNASQAKAAGRRRVSAVPKADSSQRMKESKARSVTPRPDIEDGQTAEGGKKEAAGGRFRAREAAMRSNPPPSVRRVQRGRPPTAAQPEAEAQHAASVRAQAARPSAAPCRDRRSGGRGVCERRAWRAACSSSRTRHEQARSEWGGRLHAGGRQQRAGHGPERWNRRPRSGAGTGRTSPTTLRPR